MTRCLCVLFATACLAQPPVDYVGSERADKRFYDGALPHVVGAHRYQAMRANRTYSHQEGERGWTYNHQPYLAYWRDRFYLQYLSNPVGEHVRPGRTLVLTSPDGREWTEPQVVFPIYTLPDGTSSVMHQRMGFYIAPNGRLLTLGFYGRCAHDRVGPNNGDGVGRVVREIRPDGSFGPIYFIRYNRHAGFNETNTSYPFYTTSDDASFREACDSLLADRLMTLQWWEEDRAKDGFYALEDPAEETKAFSYYRRPDDVLVGFWKNSLTSLSRDNGQSWSPVVEAPTLHTCSAKVWAQRTEDGRYVLVYNDSATRRNRFPMAAVLGDDGSRFDTMLALEPQVPPMRFYGIHKNPGPQYPRGIFPGNGNPPGEHMWNVWSMNKEDIWVSRTWTPVHGKVGETVDEDFEGLKTPAELELWSLYVPQWAPISIVDGNLELRDEDPYDYALAERAFPAASRVTARFRVMVKRIDGNPLHVELQSVTGSRPVRLRFNRDQLTLDGGRASPHPIEIKPGEWLDVEIQLDLAHDSADIWLNGERVRQSIELCEDAETVERVVFRTGLYRGLVPSDIVDGEPATSGYDHEDRPAADQKAPPSVFLINRLAVQ